MKKNIFIKEIESFFKDNVIDIEKSNQFLSRKKKTEIIELKNLGVIYSSFHPEQGYHSCSCQNRINDLVLLLQLFVKKDKKEKELKKFLTMQLDDLRKTAKDRGIRTDDTFTKKEVIDELQK